MKDVGIRTGRDLAARLGWQESKVSRILTAVTPPSEDDVHAWCVACNAPDEIPGLIASLRMAASAYMEWRRMERAGLRAAQESVWPVYQRTRMFRVYASSVLPGLVQTPGYTEAVLRNVQARRGLTDDIDEAVRVRMERQQILDDTNRSFVFVLEEPVLRTLVCDEGVMAEQLGHLLHVATAPNVSLRVIPWMARRAHPPAEAFIMHDQERVAVEMISAYLVVTQPREIALYEQAFAELAGLSVNRGEARRLIAAAIAELG